MTNNSIILENNVEKRNRTNNFSQNSSEIKTQNSKNVRKGKRQKQNMPNSKNSNEKEHKDSEHLDLNKSVEKDSFEVVVWNLHRFKGGRIETFKDKNEPTVKKRCSTKTISFV